MAGDGLQPAAPTIVPGRRTERVVKVAPLYISATLAETIVAELHQLAVQRNRQELEQRMRAAYQSDPRPWQQYDPAATTEDAFVNRHLEDPHIQAIAQIPSYERYTFLAHSSNVQFDGPNFQMGDLPRDVDTVNMRADGPNGRFIQVNLQSKFKDFNEVRNWQLNQILIQAEDSNWVNAICERFRGLLEPQRFRIRALVYRNSLKLFWASVVLLLFAEYRLARWLYPTFNLKTPLSGTGALIMFGVLLANLIALVDISIAGFCYWFPFFEIEENLSRSRTASQKTVTATLSAIYIAATLNVLAFVFGPAVGRLIGHS